MDERTFEFNNISIEIAPRTIEFWRGEYAKRRVFKENKDSYRSIKGAIKTLQAVAEHFFILINGDEEAEDSEKAEFPRDYELSILDKIADGSIAELFSEDSRDGKLCESISTQLQSAYDLSIQYGYVISDLSLDEPIENNKTELLRIVQQLYSSYWKQHIDFPFAKQKQLSVAKTIHDVQDLMGPFDPNRPHMKIITGVWQPRHYGPNANPWHRTHILKEKTPFTIDNHRIQSDISFAVNGIADEDYPIRATIGKIEREICLLRLNALYEKRETFLAEFKTTVASNCIDLDTRQLFEESSTATIDSLVDDKQQIEKHRLQILPKEKKSFSEMCLKYKENRNEINEIEKRTESANTQMHSAPVKGENAEISRAKGLYLWDAVHIEGKTKKEALEDLKLDVADLCGEKLFNITSANYKQYNLLKITDESIQTGRFLTLS